jgi:putative SOS response-associated peptidase YedK
MKAGERLDVMRWGLVPFWAKDIKVGFSNINAKDEGIEGKPAFREAFQRRRCLVPVDNFYEWAKTATGKQPYAIALADRGLMGPGGSLGDVAFAGWREGPQLCDHHDDTKRDVRAAA